MRSKTAVFLCCASCVQGSTASESTLEAPRVIAISSNPAESAPGTNVHFEATIAPTSEAVPGWSLCQTPRRALDNTAASPACATQDEQAIGAGVGIDVQIPVDACRIFGSETPAGFMPNLADGSGGYYQPLRVAFGTQTVVVRQRIRCALPSAPIDAARTFAEDYRPNQAPVIVSIQVTPEGALHAELAPGETYLLYNPQMAGLKEVQEQLTLRWFTTNGSVEPARSTRPDAIWLRESSEPGQLWLVVRDDRGASTAQAFR